jgi:glycosyltransferase involved in cell wall biosynthesis
VFFENTALALRNNGIECSFVLINCTNKALHLFLLQHGFLVTTIEANSLLKTRKQIYKCKRILKELKVTHVHCHLAQANWIGLWASKIAGVKNRIYTRHSGKPLHLNWKEKIIDKVQNYLATQIVAISQNIDELLEEQKVPKHKRIIIHHGFDIQRFSTNDQNEVNRIRSQYNPSQKYPVIGVIARRFELKGIQYTIQAFRNLLNDYPDALLCLFGDPNSGDYNQELNQILTNLPSDSTSSISFEFNVFDLYSLFDVYVHVPVNKTCEAFGQTYVEALASKVPSVFTLSGIAREFIIDKENAVVVPFKDEKAILYSIKMLLEDKEFANNISSKGYSDVTDLFSFSNYIKKLTSLYK